MMLKRNQQQIVSASGTGQVVRVALALAFVLLVSGAVTTVQAQKIPGAFSSSQWFGSINPHFHTPYYLPYYDQNRVILDCFYVNFNRWNRNRRYNQGYWYSWTFNWGRYDVPNTTWWTFGEGFVDEYGTGGIWTASDPRKSTELKAIQTVEREIRTRRATREATRITQRRGMGSSGISASRGSSIGSSGGGSSIGSSGGGGGRGGKK